ncbi:hypothetical protein [Poriferisphaera corsica]|nr:hypothetical protein [Poriferisphaera corsica]
MNTYINAETSEFIVYSTTVGQPIVGDWTWGGEPIFFEGWSKDTGNYPIIDLRDDFNTLDVGVTRFDPSLGDLKDVKITYSLTVTNPVVDSYIGISEEFSEWIDETEIQELSGPLFTHLVFRLKSPEIGFSSNLGNYRKKQSMINLPPIEGDLEDGDFFVTYKYESGTNLGSTLSGSKTFGNIADFIGYGQINFQLPTYIESAMSYIVDSDPSNSMIHTTYLRTQIVGIISIEYEYIPTQ